MTGLLPIVKLTRYGVLTLLVLVLTLALIGHSTSNTQAAINETINFQGKLVDQSDGTNFSGACATSCDFTFRIYDASTGGTELWSEVQTGVAVNDGIFNVRLGSVTTFASASLEFDSADLYLQVEVNADGAGGTYEEVFDNPRIQLTAVPFAFRAKYLDGVASDGFVQIVPGSAQDVTTAATSVIHINENDGGNTPNLIELEVAGSDVFVLGNGGSIDLNSSETTNDTFNIDASTNTTGDGLQISYNSTNLTSGFAFRVDDNGTDRFTIGDDGVLAWLGAAGVDAVFTTGAGTDLFNILTGNLKVGDGTPDIALDGEDAYIEGTLEVDGTVDFGSNVDFNNNELIEMRIENQAAAPTCDATTLGRQYYDTVSEAGFICIESAPATYTWFDFTLDISTTATKVITVGSSGEDQPTIADAANYFTSQGINAGIILLTAETHAITSTVDLEQVTLIGANQGETIINISGAGVAEVKETTFNSLTINVDAGLTSNFALDAKNDGVSTTSAIFEWVDFTINGTKRLIDSSAGTAPTVIGRFESTSASSGTGLILTTQGGSNLNAASTFIISSQGGSGALDFSDWDVEISGSANVVTTGTITTTPDNTIFIYPGMNIQEAVDSLPSGGFITLLPGTHSITDTVSITNDGIQIIGYGDSTVIQASGFASTADTVAAIQIGVADGTAPADNVVLKDFRVEVNGDNIHGVRAAGGSDNQIYNLTIVKTAGAGGTAATARMGIHFIDGTAEQLVRPVIQNSRIFGDSGAGAYFTDGIHLTSDPVVAGIFGNGSGITNALVDGNNVDYVRETAAVFYGVEDSSLFNNRFSRMGAGGGGAYGIFMGNMNRVNMTGNIVSGSLSTNSIAIGVESFNFGAAKQTTNSVFTANVIDGEANSGTGFATGFQIGATANTQVTRNTFIQNSILGASNVATIAFDIRGDTDENSFSNNVLAGGTNAWDTGFNFQNTTSNENLVSQNKTNNVTAIVNDGGTDTKFGVIQHQAAGAPAVTNDADEGYFIGTIWIDTTNDETYISVDDSSGAAVWTKSSGSDLDDAYDNDADKILGIDDINGLELLSSTAGNITFDLQSTGDFIIQDNNTTFLTISDTGDFNYTLDATDNPSYLIENLGTGASFRVNDASADTTPFIIDNAGNVGIGELTPAAALEVVGSARFGDGTNYGEFDADGDLLFTGTADYLVGDNDYAFRNQTDEDIGLFYSSTNNEIQILDSTGATAFEVGVLNGTNEGTITAPALTNCDLIFTDATGILQCGTNQGAVFDVYDDVGGNNIGGTAETINLGDNNLGTTGGERQIDSNYTFNEVVGVDDSVTVNSDGTYEITFSCGFNPGTNGRTSGRCFLETDTGGGFAEVAGSQCFTYNRNNANGEGSCSRTVILDLVSTDDIRVRAETEAGNSLSTLAEASSLTIKKLISPGADLAEIYYTNDNNIEAGEIVSIDASIYAGVKKATAENQQSIIGVISTQPGSVIGYEKNIETEGKAVLLALSGRVPVKIDPESENITAGDLITVSENVEGFGQKAVESGIVVGKALESWEYDPENPDDTIMVFVGISSYSAENNEFETTTESRKAIKTSTFNISDVEEYLNNKYSINLISEMLLPSNEDEVNEELGNSTSDLILNRNVIIDSLTIKNEALFEGTIEFKDKLYLSEDSIGQAEMKAEHTKVEVKFETDYLFTPIITLTPLDFDGDYKLTNVTKSGFTIEITSNNYEDVIFNWHAFSTKNLVITESEDKYNEVRVGNSNNSDPQPSSTPFPTPSPEPTAVDEVTTGSGSQL